MSTGHFSSVCCFVLFCLSVIFFILVYERGFTFLLEGIFTSAGEHTCLSCVGSGIFALEGGCSLSYHIVKKNGMMGYVLEKIIVLRRRAQKD